MKLIRFKFIWLLLLPLLFCNSVCNNGLDANQRNVHIRIEGSSSASACDKIMVGSKRLTLYVYVQEYDQTTGQYKNVTNQEVTAKNTWDDGFAFDFTLERKPYRIIVQGVQDCSACCGIGSSTCTEPPAFFKTANLFFYGERTIIEDGGNFSVGVSLNNCDCRGC